MSKRVRITVAESSDIVRGGIIAILQQAGIQAELSEITEAEHLRTYAGRQRPDILIVNPSVVGLLNQQQLRKELSNPDLKIIALQTSLIDTVSIKSYDEVISIYDGAELIKEKIIKLISNPESIRRHEALSQREKEVIACVVEGMTNKQIADKLFLSAHTIITHRRNISAKLGIHSTAGLTIYAIVNKLVDIDNIAESVESNQ